MDALKEAIALRDAHEVAEHAYKHVVRDTSATPFGSSSGRPKGRPRSRELTTV